MDANANRAREALRVVEDCARFILDDADAAREAKDIRHGLASALAREEWAGKMLASRDTPEDVGREIAGALEYTRQGASSIAAAAGKRITEALRALEECVKSLHDGADSARRIEALRYRAYELERRVVMGLGAGRARQWQLCVVLTERVCTHHAWDIVARMALENGADCLQLREKDLTTVELVRRARNLTELARPFGASVIVNDRVDVAMISGADGVHLGHEDMSVREARRIAGFALLVGITTHDIPEAEAAMREGADYCGVGQMFPTTTKQRESKKPIEGPAYMRAYADHVPTLPPHLAIGGISTENVGDAVRAGARGVAVSGAVCGAPNPGEAVRAILESVESGRRTGARERMAT